MRANESGSPGRPLADRSADAPEATDAPRTIIVPRRPGPLREYQPRRQRPRDELDELIDGLFGPATDEKPSRFDAGLVVVGLGLTTWAVILDGPSAALWIGIAAVVLGLALPARAVLRRFESSSAGGSSWSVVDRGLRLDVSHPATQALVGAYARLMQMSHVRGARDPKQAVSAGHAALVEIACVLDGQPPDGPEQVQLVSMRTAALEAFTHQMLRPDVRSPAPTAVHTQGRAPLTRSASRQIPVERRRMRPRAQAGASMPSDPRTSFGRRS